MKSASPGNAFYWPLLVFSGLHILIIAGLFNSRIQ